MSIILFPEFETLKTEIEKLRAEIPVLLSERDTLELIECKNLETAYLLVFGALEYKAFEYECKYLRLKRKLELIQAKINRQEKIVEAEINNCLDEEFASYTEKLEEQLNQINSAIERNSLEMLSDADTKEIKKLYHIIVKRLHPDLHPELSDAQGDMFYKAVEAYEHGDLRTIQIIHETTSDEIFEFTSDNIMLQMTKEKDRLNTLLEFIKEDIEKIKKSFPYNQKDLLADDEKIEMYKNRLNSIINSYTEMIEIYSSKIKQLLR